MERRIYIHTAIDKEDIIPIFTNLSENIIHETTLGNTIVFKDVDYNNLEPVDLESVHELITSDFNKDLIMIIEPFNEHAYPWTEELINIIPELPKKVLSIEDVIIKAVILQKYNLVDIFRKYILSNVRHEMFNTVRAFIANNMNSSLTAKNIYMHRNTVNYRIDHFIEATHIDVRSFKGALAVYILFD